MNAMPMESIFLLLSGVVLAAGVLYWFWSHIQLTQKKVQLLENAVFELRGMLTAPLAQDGGGGRGEAPASGPGPVYNDLADDDWDVAPPPPPAPPPVASTPLEHLQESADDLQPGGRLEVPVIEEKELDKTEQFRELFIQHEERNTKPAAPAPAPAPVAAPTASSLDAMPVRELRRLAEQRGLTGTSDMKKKELVSALRQLAAPPKEEEEKTIHLDEISADEVTEAPVLE